MNGNHQEITIAPEGTHHLYRGHPLYAQRYLEVLSFHDPPQLAAARDLSGAFHITYDGNPAYPTRFIRTFGFYFDLATVISKRGWGHIRLDGSFLTNIFYAWAGNFQDGLCTVRDADGHYFHITLQGARAYLENYAFAGDFYQGKAAVYTSDGFSFHIDALGHPLYPQRYFELGTFHKGFAPARDAKGWCHIRPTGEPVYEARYAAVEPFYNGFALTRTFSGRLGLLDESGKWVRTIRESEIIPAPSKISRNEGLHMPRVLARFARVSNSKVLVIGNICAGKTTLVQQLCPLLKGTPAILDDFRQKYGNGTIAGDYLAYYHLLLECASPQPRIVEFSGAGPHKWAIRLALQESHLPSIVIYVPTPVDTCIARARAKHFDVPYPAWNVAPADSIPAIDRELLEDINHSFWSCWPHSVFIRLPDSRPPELFLDMIEDILKEQEKGDSAESK